MATEAAEIHRAPTEPAVARLLEFFGVPEEGSVIAWEDLEEVLSMGRNSARFRTVVAAWRAKLFREHNVFMAAVGGGVGLVAAPPNTRVDVAARKVEQGRRYVEKGILLATSTDQARLDADRKQAVASIASLSGAVFRLHAAIQPKELPSGECAERRDRGYSPGVSQGN